jgi:hypothetical protein
VARFTGTGAGDFQRHVNLQGGGELLPWPAGARRSPAVDPAKMMDNSKMR